MEQALREASVASSQGFKALDARLHGASFTGNLLAPRSQIDPCRLNVQTHYKDHEITSVSESDTGTLPKLPLPSMQIILQGSLVADC